MLSEATVAWCFVRSSTRSRRACQDPACSAASPAVHRPRPGRSGVSRRTGKTPLPRRRRHAATAEIVDRVRQAFLDKEVSGDVEGSSSSNSATCSTTADAGAACEPTGRRSCMVAGVNGSGKTTSHRQAGQALQDGRQEGHWWPRATPSAPPPSSSSPSGAERIGCDIVKSQQGSDPASRGPRRLREGQGPRLRRADRGHRRPAAHADAPDARTGEDPPRRRQADRRRPARGAAGARRHHRAERHRPGREFTKAVQCTGIILTKLDGTAKGGAIFAIKQKLGPAGQVHRRRREARRPGAVRPGHLRRRLVRVRKEFT